LFQHNIDYIGKEKFLNLLKHKIIKNGIYYVIGGILIQGINFFSLPIFTRILTPADFGVVSVYTAWMNIMSIFICFQIYGSLGNARISYSPKEFKNYKENMIVLSTVIFFVWIFIFILFNSVFVKLLNLDFQILICLLIHSFFFSIINFKVTDLLFEERPKKRLFLSFLNITIMVFLSIIFVIFVLTDKKYMGRILGGTISSSVIGIFIYFSYINFKKIKLDFKYWKFGLKITIPLIFHTLSHIILGNSNKIMLEKFKGFEITGIYTFVMTLGMIINVLWSAFNNAWVPWFYENSKEGNHELIKDYAIKYLRFFTYICVGFLMLVPEVAILMGTKNYSSGINLLPYITMGYYFIFCYSFSVNYELFCQKTVFMAIGTIVAALFNILINFILIPKYGSLGASLGTAVSYLCLFIFHETIMRLIIKHKILDVKNYIEQIFILLITILIYYLDRSLIRYLYLLIVSICYLFYFYKSYKNNV
jgi:O-antigen/teichoic acid export membrane protein